MIKALFFIGFLCQAIMGVSCEPGDDLCVEKCASRDYCKNKMKYTGPLFIWKDGAVIEDLIIVAEPTSEFDRTQDYALKIVANNVTIRNVIIYHPANGMGIFGWYCHNLTIENVEIHTYGNPWGAQPCPRRRPFSGFECTNMRIYYSENLVLRNVLAEGGSRGISLRSCHGAQLYGVVGKNSRGPFPGGSVI